jgi:hypothetical protein
MTKDDADKPNKRRHFRIEYPKLDRPLLVFDKQKLEIVDLAEKGVKFACGGVYKPKAKDPIIAKVVFKDGKEFKITGIVLRYDAEKDIGVLTLQEGIPYPKMMEEQLALIRKYKR